MSIFRKIDVRIGRTVYKNNSGFINNFFGDLELKKNEVFNRSGFKYNPSICKDVEAYKRDGFLLGSLNLESEILETIQKKYDFVMNTEGLYRINCHKSKENGHFAKTALDIAENIPELKNVLTEYLKQFVEANFCSNFEVTNLIAYRIDNIPEKILEQEDIIAQRWHCDYSWTATQKAFILINDVGTGGAEALSIQDTKESIKRGYKGRTKIGDEDFILNKKISFNGKAGDIMFLNTSKCLHRQWPPAKGEYYDFLMVHFIPSKKPVASNWLDQIENYGFGEKPKDFKRH